MKKNILVTGANGQLGNEIRQSISKYKDYNFIFVDVNDFDIADLKSVTKFFKKNKINFIINCAAYTNVDGAETETKKAEEINALGVSWLADMAKNHNCPLIHISTDYVFDGRMRSTPYTENDMSNPDSAYGRTKYIGEQMLLTVPKHIIIRTSWLYSSFGNNFVKTMLKHGKEKSEMSVVYDQIGTPTYAADLAKVVLLFTEKLIEKTKPIQNGIYNFSNEGVASWYDFAVEIMNQSGIDCKIKPILTKDYPTPATRPHFSILDKSKIKETLGIEIPHWKESLIKCLKIIEKN